LHDAIPELSAIALDTTEDAKVREQALYPGLAYMQHPAAIKTASVLASDKLDGVRRRAFWVLANHGTDEAIEVLAGRLRANDKPLLVDLILALRSSRNPRAGRIVFDLVDFSLLPRDEPHLQAYCYAMHDFHIAEARENILFIAQQSEWPYLCSSALDYLSYSPGEDVVPALIAYLQMDKPVRHLPEMLATYLQSPALTDDSKRKISAAYDDQLARRALHVEQNRSR
jgi:HEAT repeat protein